MVCLLSLLSFLQYYPQRTNICSPVVEKKINPKLNNNKKNPKPLKGMKRAHCHNMLPIMSIDCKESTQAFVASRLGS